MFMKGLAVVLCIALFFACMPLVKAQEQPATGQPAIEQPGIHMDIAEALSALGMAPLISLGLDFIFAAAKSRPPQSMGIGPFVSSYRHCIQVCRNICPCFT